MDKKNDLLSIFHSVDNLLEIYENPYWFNLATADKMDVLFSNALTLERIYKDLSSKSLLSNFEKKLQEWWIHRGAPYEYEIEFFERVCDKIFYNLMVNTENIPVAEKAVAWYLKHCGAERLNFMTNVLFMDGSCYRMLANFMEKSVTTDLGMKCQLLLSFWIKELNLGRKDCVISHIQTIESSSVSILLFVLSLQTSNPEGCQIQGIVLDTILDKVKEGELFPHITNVDGSLLVSVAKRYSSFMDALLRKMIQVGRQYSYVCECGVYSWINEKVDISYSKYVLFFKCLYNNDDIMRSKLLGFLQELIMEPNCSFWENVARDSDVYM